MLLNKLKTGGSDNGDCLCKFRGTIEETNNTNDIDFRFVANLSIADIAMILENLSNRVEYLEERLKDDGQE